MTTFTVTNFNDSGAGSLRAAIDAANAEAPNSSNTIQILGHQRDDYPRE